MKGGRRQQYWFQRGSHASDTYALLRSPRGGRLGLPGNSARPAAMRPLGKTLAIASNPHETSIPLEGRRYVVFHQTAAEEARSVLRQARLQLR